MKTKRELRPWQVGERYAELAAVYTDITLEELRRSPLASPAPVVLLQPSAADPQPSALFNGFWLSPNGATAAGVNSIGGSVAIASATASGPVTATPSVLGGFTADFFTADSSHLFFPNLGGGLAIYSVANPTSYVVAGSASSVVGALAAGAPSSVVVFNINPTNPVGTDLLWIDTAMSSPPALIAHDVMPSFFLAQNKSTIVYAFAQANNALSGIYTLAVP